jgi:hypothetical protein
MYRIAPFPQVKKAFSFGEAKPGLHSSNLDKLRV